MFLLIFTHFPISFDNCVLKAIKDEIENLIFAVFLFIFLL